MPEIEFYAQIIVSIIIGGTIAYVFYHLNSKTLKKIEDGVEGISNRFIDLTKKTSDEELISDDPKPITKINEDSKYGKKEKICMKLLEEKKWTWRSGVILMRESRMNNEEFENFVRKNDQVVKSKISDINGNDLFSLRSKLGKKS